jgi:hypothetical protein
MMPHRLFHRLFLSEDRRAAPKMTEFWMILDVLLCSQRSFGTWHPQKQVFGKLSCSQLRHTFGDR